MSARPRPGLTRPIAVFATALLVAALTACGSDDKDEGQAAVDPSHKTTAIEKAFLTGMVSHHQSAIEMAAIAERQAEDPFIKKLADDIESTQKREVAQMGEIYTQLLGGQLTPDPRGHDGLGLTAAQAGMTHSADTNDVLRVADPFDRAFVDEMVPHHEGAVRMSRVLLKTTKDAPLRELAEAIISAQEREIKEMNAFRTKRFGGPVPAGAGHGSGGGGKPGGTGGGGAKPGGKDGGDHSG